MQDINTIVHTVTYVEADERMRPKPLVKPITATVIGSINAWLKEKAKTGNWRVLRIERKPR